MDRKGDGLKDGWMDGYIDEQMYETQQRKVEYKVNFFAAMSRHPADCDVQNIMLYTAMGEHSLYFKIG